VLSGIRCAREGLQKFGYGAESNRTKIRESMNKAAAKCLRIKDILRKALRERVRRVSLPWQGRAVS